jgi:hypothetical protein
MFPNAWLFRSSHLRISSRLSSSSVLATAVALAVPFPLWCLLLLLRLQGGRWDTGSPPGGAESRAHVKGSVFVGRDNPPLSRLAHEV